MRRRPTKDQMNERLKRASGLDVYYMAADDDTAVPYISWLFGDTEVSESDTTPLTIRDYIVVYLSTTDYDEARETAIIREFSGCDIVISRSYNTDENLHIAMITITLITKLMEV